MWHQSHPLDGPKTLLSDSLPHHPEFSPLLFTLSVNLYWSSCERLDGLKHSCNRGRASFSRFVSHIYLIQVVVFVSVVGKVWQALLFTFWLSVESNWLGGVIYWHSEDKQQQQPGALQESSSKHLLAQKWQQGTRKGAVDVGNSCSCIAVMRPLATQCCGERRQRAKGADLISGLSECHSSVQFSSPEAAEVSIRLTFLPRGLKTSRALWSMGLLSSWPGVCACFVCTSLNPKKEKKNKKNSNNNKIK